MDSAAAQRIQHLIENIERVVFGKHDVVKLCVTGLLARGHILIEDVPGIGKTTIAQAIARSMQCTFSRIQFTSDMLPSDILGVSVLDPRSNEFVFRKGPIFANVVLADEINRTPPKTQSALLEAMSEYQVTVDGRPYELARPFIVMATQNPVEYEGTYTLPESQLDRFMLRVTMGYPPADDELRIMRRRDPRKELENLQPVLTGEELVALQDAVGQARVDESVARYILDIIQGTREHEQVMLGASPRGSLTFYEACQARAVVEGRDFVTPGDVKVMAVPLLAHRILVKSRGADLATAADERGRVIRDVVQRIPVPR
ncbi:MAG: MoxR family ATPase [Candidatus Hydrogenedentes bacterium]|nr:MoxR family ATPase [Candidatus Hydrogenedentota bacterium]